MSDRDILLQLCASLTLAETMGDVQEDVLEALKLAGCSMPAAEADFGEWPDDIQRHLARMGVTTLYGSSIAEES